MYKNKSQKLKCYKQVLLHWQSLVKLATINRAISLIFQIGEYNFKQGPHYFFQDTKIVIYRRVLAEQES